MRQSFSAILSSDSLFSRAIYIGFNILINLYNQMGGEGVQKSLFFVITDTCVTIEATMNRHSQMCCDSVCLPLAKIKFVHVRFQEVVNRFASIIKMIIN